MPCDFQIEQVMLVHIPSDGIRRIEQPGLRRHTVEPGRKLAEAVKIIPGGAKHGGARLRPIEIGIGPVFAGNAESVTAQGICQQAVVGQYLAQVPIVLFGFSRCESRFRQ
jgi:hypothetical protein